MIYAGIVDRLDCLWLQTPLHEAAWHKHLGACRVLLRNGAHLNAKTEKGNTALELTREPFRSVFIEHLLPQRLP